GDGLPAGRDVRRAGADGQREPVDVVPQLDAVLVQQVRGQVDGAARHHAHAEARRFAESAGRRGELRLEPVVHVERDVLAEADAPAQARDLAVEAGAAIEARRVEAGVVD